MMDAPFDVVMIGPYPKDQALIKGGVQASVMGLSRALLKQPGVARVKGFSIPLAAEHGVASRTADIDGIDVTYLNAPYALLSSSIIHLPAVMRAIRALNRPVAHVHGTGLFQTLMCRLLRRSRIPFVWTLHGITEKETRQRQREHPSPGNAARHFFYTRLERNALAVARHIFVDTPYVRDEIHTPNAVHVLPIGIFTQEFAALRERPRTAPVILSLGVIDPRKGHHLTLEAFASLSAQMPQARLIIAGSLFVPAYFDLLKQRVSELGLQQTVEFLIDRPRTEIVEVLGRARVLALHSQEESQGIALCEALAAGVPVVATRVGGIPYVVTDGQDGFLVAYGDIGGFVGAISRLLSDGALHARMAQCALKSSARFDWGSIAADVVKVYREAAAG